jgi:hypothetical protein
VPSEHRNVHPLASCLGKASNVKCTTMDVIVYEQVLLTWIWVPAQVQNFVGMLSPSWAKTSHSLYLEWFLIDHWGYIPENCNMEQNNIDWSILLIRINQNAQESGWQRPLHLPATTVSIQVHTIFIKFLINELC